MEFNWVSKKTAYGFRLHAYVGKNIVGYICINTCSKGDVNKAYVGQCQLPGAEGKIYKSNIDDLKSEIEAKANIWFNACLN